MKERREMLRWEQWKGLANLYFATREWWIVGFILDT